MHALASIAIGLPTKPRSGDNLTHFEVPDEGLVIAAVADGVGEHRCDWAASEAACAAIRPAFMDLASADATARLVHAAAAAHDAVQSLRGDAAGALSTLVLVAWHPASGLCRFVSVGDSRLYLVGDGAPVPLTTDDTGGEPITRDGHVVIQNGAVVFRRGVTRVLGQTEPLEFTVQEAQVPPGAMLVLTTDGGYELPSFTTRLIELQNHADLASAAEMLVGSLCREQARDDATVIFMRKSDCSAEMQQQAIDDLRAGGSLVCPGRYGHLMIPIAVGEMIRCAVACDTDGVLRGLNALTSAGLRPGRSDAFAVIRAIVDDGRQETLRAHRMLVDWAGKL